MNTDAKFSVGGFVVGFDTPNRILVWSDNLQQWHPQQLRVYDAADDAWAPVVTTPQGAGWVGPPTKVTTGSSYSVHDGWFLWDEDNTKYWNTNGVANNYCIAWFAVPVTATKVFLRSASVDTTWTLSCIVDDIGWVDVLTNVSAPVPAAAEYVFSQAYTSPIWKLHGNVTSWTDPSVCSLHNG